jgi:DNA-binding XRE family transcriptional regulator
MPSLMRKSPQRHTLAVLRTIIGITQKEMAEILECSTPTVQAIELGKLKMSMKLAGNLFNQTSVNLDWLMADDVSKPPTDYQDEPYTLETFEATQAMLFAPPQDSSDVRRSLFYVRACFRNCVDQLAVLFTRAYRDELVQLCDYKISDALDQHIEEIVGTNKLTPEEKERTIKLRLEASEPKDLQAAVRRFVEETDAIFQKRVAEFEPKPPGGRHPADANKLPPNFPRVSRKKKAAPHKH